MNLIELIKMNKSEIRKSLKGNKLVRSIDIVDDDQIYYKLESKLGNISTYNITISIPHRGNALELYTVLVDNSQNTVKLK